MHVGHLRSTIIGESICRFLEFVGHTVMRVNHVGDWGTQFGMLIQHIDESGVDLVNRCLELSDLDALYKASKRRFDDEEDFKKRSTQRVVQLQAGDEKTRKIWEKLCEISRYEFQKIYDRLQVTIDCYAESFYNSRIPGTVDELLTQGVAKIHQGARMIFTKSGSEAPLIAMKSDGGYGYDSTDLASIKYRLCEVKADRIVYVTDMGQSDHFLKLFEVAEIAGWHVPGKTRLDHIGFGVVQGEDGKKFKTRSGKAVKLVALLDEARDRALAEVLSRAADRDETKDDSDRPSDSQAAEKIGYSAVKYFDLKQHRVSPYQFSFDRMLDNKGNTAVYMMYMYARICQIMRKAKEQSGVSVEFLTSDSLSLEDCHPSERELAKALLRFPDIVDSVVEECLPHKMAEFMYDIATKFSDFYKECKVVGSSTEASRLLLCEVTRRVLDKSFYLLGIQPLQRL
eukprot:TRINITY_DN81293_c0_g1_i2.p1 TRINITY_DN81293_c0_g1~~TRINITY_DN81293_c0_g1_i2.p1  ORF type:complete len:455 (-),score=36.45 TRINITY_DN81293_c0_g1_i2:115-1479(-)